MIYTLHLNIKNAENFCVDPHASCLDRGPTLNELAWVDY